MSLRSFIICWIAISCLIPVFVHAAVTDVQTTGQTVSYLPGDDGNLQIGVTLVGDRFTDNGDGTVTDNMTGLIWLKDANCYSGEDYSEALVDGRRLNSGECGLSDGSVEGDWRLSNNRELLSLVNYKYTQPSLSDTAGTGKWQEGVPFTDVGTRYWSSTSDSSTARYGFIVNFYYGNVETGTKGSSQQVWPVRGGQRGLRVVRAGTGSGSVTSDNIAGIDCGDDCSESYLYNTTVVLTVEAEPGSTFTGWTGNTDCSDGSVTLDTAMSCTATFNLPYTITTSASPVDGGSISCTPNPVEHGSSSLCTIITNTGYAIDTVNGTCGGTLNGASYTTDVITETCTIEASFTMRFPWILFVPATTGMQP